MVHFGLVSTPHIKSWLRAWCVANFLLHWAPNILSWGILPAFCLLFFVSLSVSQSILGSLWSPKRNNNSSNNNESFEVRVQSQVGIDGRRFVHRKKTFKKVRTTRNRNGANAQKRVTIQFNATVLQSIFGILRSPKNNVRFEGSRANSTRYRCAELNSALIHPATEANSFLVCTH